MNKFIVQICSDAGGNSYKVEVDTTMHCVLFQGSSNLGSGAQVK
jgi:hypothetical protein